MGEVDLDFTRRLLVDAGLREGLHVLDVGCGSGEVTVLAAAHVGPGGRVVGIDRDENALAAARRRATAGDGPEPTFVRGDIAAPPDALGPFDAVVGRRVLMYQPDPVRTVRTLAERVRPGGLVVFQEHDATLTPSSLVPMPLHEAAQDWLLRTVAREGADLHMGLNLYGVLTRAGLSVAHVRAEAIVQTPEAPSNLGAVVRAVLPRILAQGVATAQEVGIETLQARLDAERLRTGTTSLGGMMFGAWARRPDGRG